MKIFANLVLITFFIPVAACLSCSPGQKVAGGELSPEEQEYRQVIGKRAEKIVEGLGISDSSVFKNVNDFIALQYRQIRDIDQVRDTRIKAASQKFTGNTEEKERQIKTIIQETGLEKSSLHKMFLSKLSRHLTASQIEKVKDGMTYRVLPLTYKAYLDMIPALKPDEKKHIYELLAEAREKAMDGGSSKEKHEIFGKYKGRINNFLSAQGYNIDQERKAWNERINAQKKQSNN
jgi:hypothetical protein